MGIGAYGKIPAIGDFLRIDPPPGFVRPWDDWLQRLMTTARAAFGAEYDAAYLGAPIWRFGLAADLAGPGPVMGVMMPSVDRVGRHFPLTLVAGMPRASDPVSNVNTHAPALAWMEETALATLDDEASLAGLQSALAAPGFHGDLERCLPATAVTGTFERPSLWQASAGGISRYAVIEGLPDPQLMPGLFDLGHPVWDSRP